MQGKNRIGHDSDFTCKGTGPHSVCTAVKSSSIKTLLFMCKALLATLGAAWIFTGCSTLTGYPTDRAESYAKAIEVVGKNVDGKRFKIYQLDFTEAGELSDNLGYIVVRMVNRDDQAFTQTYFLNGLKPSRLRDIDRTFDAPVYETTVGIDLSALDPQTIAAQIAEAKTHIPEGHTFKSVGRYLIQETIPSGNSFLNRNKQFGEQHATFTVRFTEDGKEVETNAGATTYLYYELEATVAPDGTMTVKAN